MDSIIGVQNCNVRDGKNNIQDNFKSAFKCTISTSYQNWSNPNFFQVKNPQQWRAWAKKLIFRARNRGKMAFFRCKISGKMKIFKFSKIPLIICGTALKKIIFSVQSKEFSNFKLRDYPNWTFGQKWVPLTKNLRALRPKLNLGWPGQL